MVKLPPLSLLFAIFALFPLRANSQSETILGVGEFGNQTKIIGYNISGSTEFELSLPKVQSSRVIYGNFSAASKAAVISESGKTKKIQLYSNDGQVTRELIFDHQSVNTIFAADLNNNGYADLAAIVHESKKAKAIVYYDPGIVNAPAYDLNLPQQALYYAPAIAGRTTVGILAYNPAGAEGKAKKARARAGKAKKSKGKKKGAASLMLIDNWGNSVKTFTLKKAPDSQIYPFSADGGCGFALSDGKKLKAYNSDGSLFREVILESQASLNVGSFSGSGNFEELIFTRNSDLIHINISTGQEQKIELKGLPNQKEQLEQEIASLSRELTDAFAKGLTVNEIMAIRDKLTELNARRQEISSASPVAGRLVRLFNGGAGSIEGVCDVVDETPQDGYGGFLIKNGDYSGVIVVLTPGGRDYYAGELLRFGSYKTFQKLKDSGYGNPDSNGMRKHFRGKGRVESLGPFIFRARYRPFYASKDYEKHCWFIKNPSSRID